MQMRSSGKEKMLTAMGEGRAAESPVVIPYLEILVRDHWEQVTDVPWWSVRSGDIDAKLQVARDLQDELDIDWVPARLCEDRQWRDRHEVRTRGRRAFLVDRQTETETELEKEPVGGLLTHRTENIVHAIEDIDRLVEVPSADEIIAGGRLDYAEAVVREFGGSLFVVGNVPDPFWGMSRCFGIYDMLSNLVERPEWSERLLERNTLASLEVAEAYARVGVDGLFLGSGYCSSDLISLEHFRRFAAPYTERIIRRVNELGMKSIHYFCGDVSDRLDNLVSMAPTCIALEEDKKQYGLEIGWIDEVVGGRVCLFGNVDAIGVLQDGTCEEMQAEAERQLEVGRRSGRFVMSLGSPVTPSTPVRKVREFIDLTRERSAVR